MPLTPPTHHAGHDSLRFVSNWALICQLAISRATERVYAWILLSNTTHWPSSQTHRLCSLFLAWAHKHVFKVALLGYFFVFFVNKYIQYFYHSGSLQKNTMSFAKSLSKMPSCQKGNMWKRDFGKYFMLSLQHDQRKLKCCKHSKREEMMVDFSPRRFLMKPINILSSEQLMILKCVFEQQAGLEHQHQRCFYIIRAVVCWKSSISARDACRLKKEPLIKLKIGQNLETFVSVRDRSSLSKLLSAVDNSSHPLRHISMSIVYMCIQLSMTIIMLAC